MGFKAAIAEDGRFDLGGIGFQIDLSGAGERRKSERDRFTIVKSKPYLDVYGALAERFHPRTILELGIFQGGGYVFLDQLFQPERMAALDLNPLPVEPLVEYVDGRPGRSAHFGMSQSDPAGLEAIIEQDLGGVLDMVVDDASHTYAHTRRSFELLFPRLRPGGLYVIEDWAWAHHPRYQGEDAPWHDQPALTNVVLDLVLMLGSNNQIAEIHVHRPMTAVVKGQGPTRPPGPPGAFWEGIVSRGRTLGRI